MRSGKYVLFMLLLAGSLAVAFPNQAHGNTISVPSASYPTIQAGIDAASPGDTVSVSPGTYDEHLVIKTPTIQVMGSSRDTTTIDGQGTGTVVWINASSVRFTGFTVTNSEPTGWGLHIDKANNVSIIQNVFSASPDGDGVNLYASNNTLIDRNTFARNLYAMNVTRSNHLIITNNQVMDNDTVGVQLKDSSECTIFQNSFVGGEDAVDIVQSSNNNITRNLVKGMSIDGISFEPDSYSTKPSEFPQNNTVIENTFQRNHIGINLQNTTQNTFYHNDFFKSSFRHVNPVNSSPTTLIITSPNTWDNSSLGGPSGGNYWDNYTGSDQNNDGIGDTPYQIGPGNEDPRPLMTPFEPQPVLIEEIIATPTTGSAPLTVSLSARISGTLTPFSYSWSFGDGTPDSSLQGPGHSYVKPGNYTVTLTVRDSSGTTDTLHALVTVTVPAPISYLVWLSLGILGALIVAGILVWRRRKKADRKKGKEKK